jgi:2,3-dihydroxybiphenyl 1,2-dioxygenase
MIDQLGYLAFEVSDLGAWKTFAIDVLGLAIADETERGFALRMDDRAARFFVTQGPADDLAAVGWEVADERSLDELITRLPGAREGTPDEAAARHVVRLVVATDPAGTRVELAFGPTRAAPPATPKIASGFVTGAQGLGHLVLSAPDPRATAAFYQDLLGFRLSDRIVTTFYGYPVDITFLHTNTRHHSLAFGGPQPKRLHHFLVEVGALDDVGAALDRALDGGVRIAQMIGRHPNDKMVSFYAFTPSGFQFEYGTGGRLVDDATWQPVVHDRVSEWGHHPPERYAPRKKREAP